MKDEEESESDNDQSISSIENSKAESKYDDHRACLNSLRDEIKEIRDDIKICMEKIIIPLNSIANYTIKRQEPENEVLNVDNIIKMKYWMFISVEFGYQQKRLFNIECKTAPLVDAINDVCYADIAALLTTKRLFYQWTQSNEEKGKCQEAKIICLFKLQYFLFSLESRIWNKLLVNIHLEQQEDQEESARAGKEERGFHPGNH